MSDNPPVLADIPQHSQMDIPTLSSTSAGTNSTSTTNGGMTAQNVKDAVYSTPVGESVKQQSAKTSTEFSNLSNSRTTPSQPAATGQPLTHYHSFFYQLLSWEEPRATTLAFLGSVLLIFGARYLPILRWTFKVIAYALAVTASAELAGKLVLGNGLASSFRPRKYFTIPKESLEASLEDVEQLINFFVIEFQRILFAENITATVLAFVSAFISYWLIKFVPFWGLSLIATTSIYLTPLIYISNKEFIDHHLSNATDVVNAQAKQVTDLANYHTQQATSTVKNLAGDYSAKAQEYIGNARGRSTSPELSSKIKSEPGLTASPSYKSSDFPHAPKQEPTPGVTSHSEQYEKSQFGGSVPAS
ncbi:MAG: hypothetical protein MMC33_009078 [Icmadophila ericetorum]|nr:hypothetical protein [Icmadophila ericetorum]